MQNLQVHHIKFRSQSGSDVEQNLIRLRAKCHAYHPVPSNEASASMPEPNRHPAALHGHASCAIVPARCSLTFTSTREPSRLMINMRRSTVTPPRSALRIREK